MTEAYRPPAGDVTPVPVHITGWEAGLTAQLGPRPRPRKRIVTRFDTVVVDTTNPTRPLLPEDPSRVQAVIIVAGVIGSSAAATSYGWLASTEALANQAAAHEASGAYISAGSTIHQPFTITGTNAVWVALDNAATTALTITVIADYET